MDKTEMIAKIRKYLSSFGEVDEKIIKTINETDRKYFMDKNKSLAYEDEAITIGYGQTISQPSTVARMISLLELKKSDTILEIGTGSLWNAAVMAQLCKKVVSLEIVEQFVNKGKEKIKELGLKNIDARLGDFRKIKEKFNKIIFTAGILKTDEDTIIGFAKEHLKENGILICPYREGPLIILKNKDGNIKKTFSEEIYVFVP